MMKTFVDFESGLFVAQELAGEVEDINDTVQGTNFAFAPIIGDNIEKLIALYCETRHGKEVRRREYQPGSMYPHILVEMTSIVPELPNRFFVVYPAPMMGYRTGE
jgi:hypothetical protein